MHRTLSAAAALFALALPGLAGASTWEIDPAHSAAQFSVRHLMVSNVRGEFGKVTGTASLDDKDITRSTVEATLDATTINTREEKRDQHLKSPDFFDVAKYPTITFKSKKVAKAGADRLKITGDLTIHGVTREVVLNVEGPSKSIKDPWGNTRRGISATTKVNRKDFGLKWNKTLETGGVVVGDDVNITIDAEMVEKKEGAQKEGAQK